MAKKTKSRKIVLSVEDQRAIEQAIIALFQKRVDDIQRQIKEDAKNRFFSSVSESAGRAAALVDLIDGFDLYDLEVGGVVFETPSSNG
jgi:ribosomal protein L23